MGCSSCSFLRILVCFGYRCPPQHSTRCASLSQLDAMAKPVLTVRTELSRWFWSWKLDSCLGRHASHNGDTDKLNQQVEFLCQQIIFNQQFHIDLQIDPKLTHTITNWCTIFKFQYTHFAQCLKHCQAASADWLITCKLDHYCLFFNKGFQSTLLPIFTFTLW